MALPSGYRIMSNGDIYGRAGYKIEGYPNNKGYLRIRVPENGKKKDYYFHKMVCEAFHGPKPFPTAVVRHLNDIRTDNRAENLVWGSQSDNMRDMVGNRAPDFKYPDDHGQRRLTLDQAYEIRDKYYTSGVTQAKLSEEYGVSTTTIGKIIAYKTYIRKG